MTDDQGFQVEQAILRTLAYFDVFDYPIRIGELWRWLYRGEGETWSAALDAVRQGVDRLAASHRVVIHDGFITLPGRQSIVAVRAERLVAGQKKWRRAKSVAQFLEVVPYVKLVAVVNTLAIDNARPESDIDLLIVTEPDRIWITRLMVTGIVEMLGYRRHDALVTNRVCLSFYLTNRALDLTPLKIADQDPHLAFWASQAVPLMDEGTYETFVDANRSLTSRLPNAWVWPWQSRLMKRKGFLRGIKRTYGRVFGIAAGNYLEAWARDYQLKKMEANTSSKAKLGTTEVVISEDVLKFHEDDRRARYKEAFRARCRELNVMP